MLLRLNQRFSSDEKTHTSFQLTSSRFLLWCCVELSNQSWIWVWGRGGGGSCSSGIIPFNLLVMKTKLEGKEMKRSRCRWKRGQKETSFSYDSSLTLCLLSPITHQEPKCVGEIIMTQHFFKLSSPKTGENFKLKTSKKKKNKSKEVKIKTKRF